MVKLLHFSQRKGLFSRTEASGFHNQPMKYWHLYGSETPVIHELAITLFSQVTSASACETNWNFSQVTSASACETNWSADEYVYCKRRDKPTTVRPLLSAVLGRTKFWSQKPWINEVHG